LESPTSHRQVAPFICLRDVTKSYRGDIIALSEISLELDRGDLVLLVGPSGAGKSTLLRTLLAAERPDAGQIMVAGRDICRLQKRSLPYLRRNIGVVFQDFKLLDDRSALQNVSISLEIRGLPANEVRQRSVAALESVGLANATKTCVAALSGGEQQRVAIARAVVANPSIILADEPTGNLDPAWSKDILNLLNGVARDGTSVLIATHDPAVVEHADYSHLIRLESGRIVEQLEGRQQEGTA